MEKVLAFFGKWASFAKVFIGFILGALVFRLQPDLKFTLFLVVFCGVGYLILGKILKSIYKQ